jgi:hypothetical protein
MNTQIILPENQCFQHTQHSYARSSQRGISNADILFVIENSTPIFKQNLIFYSLKKSKNMTVKMHKECLINMVVVMNSFGSAIVTVYKSEKAWKKIKMKSKRLSKHKFYD